MSCKSDKSLDGNAQLRLSVRLQQDGDAERADNGAAFLKRQRLKFAPLFDCCELRSDMRR